MTVSGLSSALQPRTKVLVVDDSVVVRRVVARAIESDPSLELVGVARDGQAALDKVAALRPDVVVLDLEMPVLDGFAALAGIRKAQPQLPVIVFSHLTVEGAAATLEALSLGATDFALKPRADGIDLAEEHVRVELLPRIRAVATSTPAPAPADHRDPTTRVTAVRAVVIAVSTGGPNALAQIVPQLPASLTVPVLIVQHMPELFTKALAERLDRVANVAVVEAGEGEEILDGHIYIARGGRHLTVRRATGAVRAHLTDWPAENSCRPAADVLFRSAVEVYGAGVLAIVLTGMGRDGLRGAERVRSAGGRVMVQSAATSIVASMPSAVVSAGLADAVVDLDAIGCELMHWISP